VTSLIMVSRCHSRILTVHNDETDEFGELLNSQNQSSVVEIRDFCDVRTDHSVDSSLPSARINRSKLMHLSEGRRQELLQLIDEFRECFNETPGFCPYVEHNITIDADFKPRRLREYGIPEVLKLGKSNARLRNF
jgi:hypothetical protein